MVRSRDASRARPLVRPPLLSAPRSGRPHGNDARDVNATPIRPQGRARASPRRGVSVATAQACCARRACSVPPCSRPSRVSAPSQAVLRPNPSRPARGLRRASSPPALPPVLPLGPCMCCASAKSHHQRHLSAPWHPRQPGTAAQPYRQPQTSRVGMEAIIRRQESCWVALFTRGVPIARAL